MLTFVPEDCEELEAQPEMNPRDIESTLHIETLKLGSKGSGDSVLVLVHVTYFAHLLCMYQYILTCTGLAPRVLLRARLRPTRYCACAEHVLSRKNAQKRISPAHTHVVAGAADRVWFLYPVAVLSRSHAY